MKVYTYKNCGSCKKAIKWLKEHEVTFDEVAIRETPPSVQELSAMYKHKGALKPLFNTSGMDYRSLGMKDKLPTMTDQEALELLATNGNLVKRPFVIGAGVALVGFKEDEWAKILTD